MIKTLTLMDGKQLSRPYMGVPQLWVNLSLNNLSRNRAQKLNDVFTALQHKAHWAIAFNIHTPSPGWGPTFNSYPWRLNKIAFTPEDFHKIWVCPSKTGVLPLKNFAKSGAPAPKHSILLDSTPEEILNFYNVPLKNSVVPQPWPGGGGTGIKCIKEVERISEQPDSYFISNG